MSVLFALAAVLLIFSASTFKRKLNLRFKLIIFDIVNFKLSKVKNQNSFHNLWYANFIRINFALPDDTIQQKQIFNCLLNELKYLHISKRLVERNCYWAFQSDAIYRIVWIKTGLK